MLLQNDPFRDIDAWFDWMTGRASSNGSWPMPMDAYKRGDDLWVDIDLPGVTDSVDIDVERNVLMRPSALGAQGGRSVYLAERHRGTFRRQVYLGDGLDAERIEWRYNDGVLTPRSRSPKRPNRGRSRSSPVGRRRHRHVVVRAGCQLNFSRRLLPEPPAISMSIPSTTRPPDSKKATTRPTSSVVPHRRSGISDRICSATTVGSVA